LPVSQAFLQYPQLLLSVRVSIQTLSHFTRSEGQMMGFVGVGTGVFVVNTVVTVVVGRGISVVGIAVGISVITSA
jgi:hypothetical protein